MPKYKVTRERWDIPEEKVGEFIATDDGAARHHFQKNFKDDKNWDWDELKLIRFTEEIIEISIAEQRKKTRPPIDHTRGLCHKPNVSDGFFPEELAETNPPKCKCCGAKMNARDMGSIGMEQLGIYLLVCPVCS